MTTLALLPPAGLTWGALVTQLVLLAVFAWLVLRRTRNANAVSASRSRTAADFPAMPEPSAHIPSPLRDSDKCARPAPSFDANVAGALLDRLMGLMDQVSADVDQHCTQIAALHQEVQGAENVVAGTLQRILECNNVLRTRLRNAESHLNRQRSEIQMLTSTAKTDPLTALLNRRAFDEEIKGHFAASQRTEAPLSLLLLDIDHFQQFNDRHGHQGGDAVLVKVSDCLRRNTRAADTVFRYGGEEFAILLSDTDLSGAVIVAGKLQGALAKLVIPLAAGPQSVTVSIGVAQAAENEFPSDLIRRTDAAMYAAKSAGRNCSCQHDGHATRPLVAKVHLEAQVQADDALESICQELRASAAELAAPSVR